MGLLVGLGLGGYRAGFGNWKKVVWRERQPPAARLSHQQGCAIGRYHSVSAAAHARIRPAMHAGQRPPGHIRDGLIAAAQLNDGLGRFHVANIAMIATLRKPKYCDLRSFLFLRFAQQVY